MPAKAKNYQDFETDYVKVLEYGFRGRDQHHWWLCKCKACGTEWNVRGAHIRERKSCGCRRHMNKRRDDVISRMLKMRWV